MKELNWSQIDTVLLDMDGTLLDLHFDNVFWLGLLPQKLADKTGKTLDECHAHMATEFAKVAGTIQWYCLDYWSNLLDLDILTLKNELAHLVVMRDDTLPFLDALRQSGRNVALLTNAHPDVLTFKNQITGLDKYMSTMISTHSYGASKEFQSLWQGVQADLQFNPASTLFVDDNETILAAAKQFGIGHLVAVANPDSRNEPKISEQFLSVTDYREHLDDIVNNPFEQA